MLEILMFAATPPLLLECFHHMDYSACDIQRELFIWQMMGRNMNYYFKSSKLNANTSTLCRLYTYMMELQKLNTIKICKSINQHNALLLSPISSTIRDAIPDVCVCVSDILEIINHCKSLWSTFVNWSTMCYGASWWPSTFIVHFREIFLRFFVLVLSQ